MENKISKKTAVLILTVVIIWLAIAVAFFSLADNKNVDYQHIDLKSDSNRDVDVKIAHLSDMHFPKIKVDLDKLINTLREFNTDVVAITGDLVDASAKIDACGVESFIRDLVEIAPVYYVNGNHEKANPESEKLYKSLIDCGVNILDNEIALFEKNGAKISIIGISDNDDFYCNRYINDANPDFTLLLAHRPEREKNKTYYSHIQSDQPWIFPDLVLSGHAHGGQFRLFNKGLIAPDQGLFPQFDSGLYELSERTKMCVSRGLGNSIIPLRVNNKPHVPIITISL